MKVIDDLNQWRTLRAGFTGSVGFVPTMGALHDGHLSLLRRSRSMDDITVLSIYVNPTQFNDPKDLANYPDTLDADLEAAQKLGVDYVLLPTYADMYADGFRYQKVLFKDAAGGLTVLEYEMLKIGDSWQINGVQRLQDPPVAA